MCSLRKWRTDNPEKNKANQRRWREAHPEKNRELVRAWREACPETEKLRSMNGMAVRSLSSAGFSDLFHEGSIDLDLPSAPLRWMKLLLGPDKKIAAQLEVVLLLHRARLEREAVKGKSPELLPAPFIDTPPIEEVP
jgi:hypothetical protein